MWEVWTAGRINSVYVRSGDKGLVREYYASARRTPSPESDSVWVTRTGVTLIVPFPLSSAISSSALYSLELLATRFATQDPEFLEFPEFIISALAGKHLIFRDQRFPFPVTDYLSRRDFPDDSALKG